MPGEDQQQAIEVDGQVPIEQQNIQVLSLESISSIIKDAVGGVKEYIDEALTKTKKQVRDNAKVELKFKGNRIQYEFNVDQLEKVEKAITKIEKGDSQGAVVELKAVVSEFQTRNKHIKLADKSEHGWKVVDEYKSEKLADDSDDEKRIKNAIKSAAAKAKAKPKSQKGRAHPYRRPAETHPNPERSSSFRRYNGVSRFQAPGPSTAANDYCFGCGKIGHWRRSCPFKPKDQSNQQQ